jgi:hypothetical protein
LVKSAVELKYRIALMSIALRYDLAWGASKFVLAEEDQALGVRLRLGRASGSGCGPGNCTVMRLSCAAPLLCNLVYKLSDGFDI